MKRRTTCEGGLIFIHNPNCSKCNDLSCDLDDRGYAWDKINYLDGALTPELLDRIVDGYEGPQRDLIRPNEQEWQQQGVESDKLSNDELKRFILEHPTVLQRPIIVDKDKVIVARPPEKLWQHLNADHPPPREPS